MINPKTVQFVDMIEKMAAKFDGKKKVYGFYKDNAEIIEKLSEDENFFENYIVYNDKKIVLDANGKDFYGIIKKIKDGEIKEYYKDIYVIRKEEEVLCLVGYPPEDKNLPKNEDGDDVLFVIENGRWYMV